MVEQPGTRMARTTVRPEWVGVLDFAGGRLPCVMADRMFAMRSARQDHDSAADLEVRNAWPRPGLRPYLAAFVGVPLPPRFMVSDGPPESALRRGRPVVASCGRAAPYKA
jgi:hypothetical protein